MTLFAWRLTPTFHILLIWCCKAPCFHSKEKCPCSHFASWSLEAIGHESIGAKARHAIRNAATWQHLSVYGMQSRHVETVETIRHYHCELTSCTKADTAMRADAIRLDRVQVFWDVSASVLLSESGWVFMSIVPSRSMMGDFWINHCTIARNIQTPWETSQSELARIARHQLLFWNNLI